MMIKEDHPFLEDVRRFPELVTQWEAFNGNVYPAQIIGFVLDPDINTETNIALGAVVAVNCLKIINDKEVTDYVEKKIVMDKKNFMKLHESTYDFVKINDLKGLKVGNPLSPEEISSTVLFVLKRKCKTYATTDAIKITDFTRIMKDLYSDIAINSFCQLVFQQAYVDF